MRRKLVAVMMSFVFVLDFGFGVDGLRWKMNNFSRSLVVGDVGDRHRSLLDLVIGSFFI